MCAGSEVPVDAAILDINLGGQSVYPVVDLLIAKGVPTAFISGYGAESVDRRYEQIPLMQKPIDRQVLLDLLNLTGDADHAAKEDGEADASTARTSSKVVGL